MSFPSQEDQAFWPSPFVGAIFDFTLKFHDLVLGIVPGACWVVLTPVILFYYMKKPVHVRRSILLWLKVMLAVIIACLQVASAAVRWTLPDYRTNWTTPAAVLDILSAPCLIAALYVEHCRSIRPSAVLGLYVTIRVMIDGISARSYFIRSVPSLGGLAAATLALRFILLCSQEVGKADLLLDPKIHAASGSEATSGLWSRSCLWFMVPLFRKGYSKLLTLDDLDQLGIEFSSAELLRSLSQRWERAQQSRSNALLFAGLKSWKKAILALIFPRLCMTGFNYAQPFIIRHMVLSHQQQDLNSFKGGLVGATFIAYTGAAMCQAISKHMQYRLIARIRGGLLSQIFQKTQRLKLSQAQKQAAITLISTDLEGVILGLVACLRIPFDLIDTALGMYFLTEFVHKAVFIVLLPLLLATVLGLYFGKIITPAQRSWNEVVQDRVAKTSRVLAQLPAIKMLGLGPKIGEYLHNLRVLELKASRKYRYIQACTITSIGVVDMIVPPLVIAGALFRNFFGPKIESAVIFPTLGLVSLIQHPISELLRAYTTTVAMLGCFSRIQEYLAQDEHEDPRVIVYTTPRDISRAWTAASMEKRATTRKIQRDPSRVIFFENASIAPFGMKTPVLANITLSIAPGSVTAMFGATGSGKTTILNNILGEAEVLDGVVYVDDMAIALCGQIVWLPNGTVRECIIGALAYDAVWFRAVVVSCALSEDIDQFDGGENFVIGSGGMKLSGGQRQRLSIARAVYARMATILLDDAFSALDRPTAVAILRALCGKENGLLRQSNTTVLMTSYLPECLEVSDDVILLEGGGQLVHKAVDTLDEGFKSRVVNMLYEEHRIAVEDESRSAQVELQTTSEKDSDSQSQEQGVHVSALQKQFNEMDKSPDARRKGDSRLYWLWIDQVGRWSLLLWMIPVLLMCFAEGFPPIFMKLWINIAPSNRAWFAGYMTFGVFSGAIAGPCVVIMHTLMAPRASIGLHKTLTDAVMTATLGFLSSTDSGSILNRYSVDMDLIAKQIPSGVYNNIYMSVTTLIQVGIVLSGADYMAAVLPALVGLLYFVQHVYLYTSRQLRHLEIEQQAPLVSSFRDAADGLAYIRSFGWQEFLLERNLHLLDNSQRPFYLLFCAQQLLSFVLDSISSSMATVLAVITLFAKDSSTESSSGMAFLTLLILGRSFNRVITTWTTMETALGSVSRLRIFLDNTPVESDKGTSPPPANWPAHGAVRIQNVTARYHCNVDEKHEPSAIHDINLSVEPGQKIGIMGRTGSGKSSLLMTLLGFLDFEGSITIDDVDIRAVPHDELRARLITVSQSQVELEGTLRDNLLPFDKTWADEPPNSEGRANNTDAASVNDEIIQDTLDRLGIWELFKSKKGLDTPMEKAGLSHGEKQLLCLARAVIRRRINGGNLVLMDEATGGVDRWRDQAVRDLLRDYFQGCTFIIVAHRDDSIADSDVIVRMARGKIIGVEDQR
ncbi:hypothetical protein NLG97_g6733 [Lecanicillium saksenae]|uniref:Uncharacterized protein n=1 Tax=Lecanicillium saksenae TaxID=468837 RepID=A0ACC1QPX3_9HYPO|nr:hypothetical protein NLG97_g6733 [Lecanicillium saksenae]